MRHRVRPTASPDIPEHIWETGGDRWIVANRSWMRPGTVHVSAGGWNQFDWFPAPDWVLAGLSRPQEPVEALDWLVENNPDCEWLAAAVRAVYAGAA